MRAWGRGRGGRPPKPPGFEYSESHFMPLVTSVTLSTTRYNRTDFTMRLLIGTGDSSCSPFSTLVERC